MRITIGGHALLWIETQDQAIWVDPYFVDHLMNGALTYHPARHLKLDALPTPTAIVVTHAHFDHFHPESLKTLPKDIPVIAAAELPLIEALQTMGFTQVIACQPWDAVTLGQTQLVMTPSDHEELELGLWIRDGSGSFWHMADSEVSRSTADRILTERGRVDLIATKYQPAIRSMIGYCKGMGPTFDRENVVTWLETACHCQPQMVFPYASGLCFQGQNNWWNRYAFPLTEAETVQLLQKRLGSEGKATGVLPGDVIELQAGQAPQLHSQASDFIAAQPEDSIQWEPIDTTTLIRLSDPMDQPMLEKLLTTFLQDRLIPWLQPQQDRQAGWGILQQWDVIWQVVVHTTGEERLNYWIDYGQASLSLHAGIHPFATYFTHLGGRPLLDVLQGNQEGVIFWLTAQARQFEKVIAVKQGQFVAPQWHEFPEDRISDPLTYYLQHFGVQDPPAPSLGAEPTLPSGDIAILSRAGGNAQVIAKKTLLSHLALAETERIGLPVTHDEVQTLSDRFRQDWNLHDSEQMKAWLQQVGLSVEGYTAVMQHFAAVIKLETHYEQELASLRTAHQKVATVEQHRPELAP